MRRRSAIASMTARHEYILTGYAQAPTQVKHLGQSSRKDLLPSVMPSGTRHTAV